MVILGLSPPRSFQKLSCILLRNSGMFQIIESLVSAGSNLNLKDKTDANTALHNAVLHYYSEAAQLLIDAGNNWAGAQ